MKSTHDKFVIFYTWAMSRPNISVKYANIRLEKALNFRVQSLNFILEIMSSLWRVQNRERILTKQNFWICKMCEVIVSKVYMEEYPLRDMLLFDYVFGQITSFLYTVSRWWNEKSPEPEETDPCSSPIPNYLPKVVVYLLWVFLTTQMNGLF